jgi:hypothetical protein
MSRELPTPDHQRPGRLSVLWYRLRQTVAEMNYATRRMVELQARLPE